MNPKRAYVLILALLLGCSSGPEPVVQGLDECVHCKMQIADPAFAAQTMTTRGLHEKYDSIECLLAGIRDEQLYAAIWVTDATNPGRWLLAEEAVFVQDDDIHSPMGGGLAAFSSEDDAGAVTESPPMTWKELSNRR